MINPHGKQALVGARTIQKLFPNKYSSAFSAQKPNLICSPNDAARYKI